MTHDRSLLYTVVSYLFWGAVTGLLVYGIGYASRGHSFEWMGAVLSTGVGTLYVAIMSGFMNAVGHWTGRYVPLQSKWAVAVHTITQALGILVSFLLATVLVKGLFGAFFSVTWIPILIIALVAFSAALIASSFTYMQKFHRRMRKAESAAYEAKLQALQAQIHPHFLFNAFNSIAALIRTHPEEAETVVEDLADLFRYTLRTSKEEETSLGEELRAAQLYLAIEKARYRERLHVHIDVPDDVHSARLPSMTLQPLVENAVKHGAGQTQDSCTITISAHRENEALVLHVTDTGPGFDTTDLDAVLDTGTGLTNVQERLSLFFGENAQLNLLPQGIELRLPRPSQQSPASRFDMPGITTKLRAS